MIKRLRSVTEMINDPSDDAPRSVHGGHITNERTDGRTFRGICANRRRFHFFSRAAVPPPSSLYCLGRQSGPVDGGTQSNEKMMDEMRRRLLRQADRQTKYAMNDRRLLTARSSSWVVRRDLAPDHHHSSKFATNCCMRFAGSHILKANCSMAAHKHGQGTLAPSGQYKGCRFASITFWFAQKEPESLPPQIRFTGSKYSYMRFWPGLRPWAAGGSWSRSLAGFKGPFRTREGRAGWTEKEGGGGKEGARKWRGWTASPLTKIPAVST